jgi:uncharacterized protein YoxC
MPSSTQSKLSEDALPANLFAVLPDDLKNDGYPSGRSPLGKPALIPLVRFLIIFCIGVFATLVWQSYSAREMVANSHSQVSGLTPQSEPGPQNAPNVIGPASRTVSSADQQQPNAIVLDLDGVRQSIDRIATSIASSQAGMTSSADRIATTQEQIGRSVDWIATTQQQIGRSLDRIAASQEQITRSVDQLTADQEQMTREITKLQGIEQSIRSKNPESSMRPASASAPKHASRPALASAPKPISPTPTLPEPTGLSWPGPSWLQGAEESAKQRP